MIKYGDSAFGLWLILRNHGSAVYRSILPALLSVACLLFLRKFYREGYTGGGLNRDSRDEKDIEHPYVVGVVVVSTTMLLIFRANFAYARYWEGCSAILQFMGKWMDSTIQVVAYHMQCDHYDSIKPPSYYDYPELNSMFLTRSREQERSATENGNDGGNNDRRHNRRYDPHTFHGHDRADRAFEKSINCVPYDNSDHHESLKSSLLGRQRQLWTKSTAFKSVDKDHPLRRRKPRPLFCAGNDDGSAAGHDWDVTLPRPLEGLGRLDGSWSGLFKDGKATFYNSKEHGDNFLFEYSKELPSFASHHGGRTPPLFLQELSHLSSLMVAVALSTLRNDINGATSPLGVYIPGAKWPEVDSDKIHDFKLTGSWAQRVWSRFLYLIGGGKSPEERTRYNAARPLPVLGGVSDNEILFLQMAHGPYAKTTLTWHWLVEFVIREHLSGSTGKVSPPIITRFIQTMSDGMIFYNHARKVMFVPFPFPHAQLSALFIFVAIPAIALLMEQYADDLVIASLLTFFSVMCLSGVHEVARELENPFRNVPNDLPTVTFQAQYNEALITMFSGYHPDHFWIPRPHNPSSSDNDNLHYEHTDDEGYEVVLSGDSFSEKGPCHLGTLSAGVAEVPVTTASAVASASTSRDNNTFTSDDRQLMSILQKEIEEFEREIQQLKTKVGI